MRLKNVVLVCLLGSLWIAGCGGDDKKSGGGGASYSDISDSIESPTGTLAADNAKSVADAYTKTSLGSGAGGERIAQTGNQACPSSGDISVGSSSGSAVHADYNDCCGYTAGCCLNGSYDFYYSSEQGGTYSYCASYDISASCSDTTIGDYSLTYSGCFGTDGTAYYVVEVASETFVVSGSYYAGSGGTLKIRGSNGSFSCTYNADGTGMCTGAGTFSF